MFYQDKFDEAIVEYNRYSRFSDNPVKIEHAEFKSCEASYLLANDFKFDQGNAAELMDKLQVFIEKYPDRYTKLESIYGSKYNQFVANEINFRLNLLSYNYNARDVISI